jgi:hypothetical protein
MPSIVEERPFAADLGAATATGFLLVADPIEDSIVRGTLTVMGLEDVSFEARVDRPFQVTLLKVTITISFDPVMRAFTGSAQQAGAAPHEPTSIVGLG